MEQDPARGLDTTAGPAVTGIAAVVLLDRYDLFDMDWIAEWWPVPVFLLGGDV